MFRFRPGQIGLQLLGFGYQRIENYVPDPQQFTGKPPPSIRTVRRRRFDMEAQPVPPQYEALPPMSPTTAPTMSDFGVQRTPETRPTGATPPPSNIRPARAVAPATPSATPSAPPLPQRSDGEGDKIPADLLRILELHQERIARQAEEKANEPPPPPKPERPRPPRGLMEETAAPPPARRAAPPPESPVQRKQTSTPQMEKQPAPEYTFEPPAGEDDYTEQMADDLPRAAESPDSGPPAPVDNPAPQPESPRRLRRQRVSYDNEPDRRRAVEPTPSEPPELDYIEAQAPVSNETQPVARRTPQVEQPPTPVESAPNIEDAPAAEIQDTVQPKVAKPAPPEPEEFTELPAPSEPADYTTPETVSVRRKPRSVQRMGETAANEDLADVWRSMVTKHLMPMQRNSEMTGFGDLPLLDDEVNYQTEQMPYDFSAPTERDLPGTEQSPPGTDYRPQPTAPDQPAGITDSPAGQVARQADFPVYEPDEFAEDEYNRIEPPDDDFGGSGEISPDPDWYERTPWRDTATEETIGRGDSEPPVFQQTEQPQADKSRESVSRRQSDAVQRQPADDVSDFTAETDEPVPTEKTPPPAPEAFAQPTNGRSHGTTHRRRRGLPDQPVQRRADAAGTAPESTPDHIQRDFREPDPSDTPSGNATRSTGQGDENPARSITEYSETPVLDDESPDSAERDERPATGAEADLLQLLNMPQDTPIVGRKPGQSVQRAPQEPNPRSPEGTGIVPHQPIPLDQALMGMNDDDEPIQRLEADPVAPSSEAASLSQTLPELGANAEEREDDNESEDGINVDRLTREVLRRLRSKLRSDQDRRSGH